MIPVWHGVVCTAHKCVQATRQSATRVCRDKSPQATRAENRAEFGSSNFDQTSCFTFLTANNDIYLLK